MNNLRFLFRYGTEEERNKIEDQIIQEHTVGINTRVLSRIEVVVRNSLVELQVPSLYEPLTFPSIKIRGKYLVHKPDFLAYRNSVDGKVLAFQPHGLQFIDYFFLEKLKKFGEKYGLYMVLISANIQDIIPISPEKIRLYVDEFWVAPYNTGEKQEKTRAWTVNKIAELLRRSVFEAPYHNGLTRILEQLKA